ncbi:acyl carrier protein [Streptomyces sp. NPDC093109]|uniref:acyl carrier protein n=1 Tax=Streptomyces sp. NPDC093109 TaxID=3154977 RepID=UPI00344F7C7B
MGRWVGPPHSTRKLPVDGARSGRVDLVDILTSVLQPDVPHHYRRSVGYSSSWQAGGWGFLSVPSASELRGFLCARIAEQCELRPEDVETDRPTQEFGLSSRGAVTVIAAVQEFLGRPLSPALVWEFPTVDLLVDGLLADAPAAPRAPRESRQPQGDPDIAGAPPGAPWTPSARTACCAPATSASSTTTSSTSRVASRTSSSSTAATTTPRTSKRPSTPPTPVSAPAEPSPSPHPERTANASSSSSSTTATTHPRPSSARYAPP